MAMQTDSARPWGVRRTSLAVRSAWVAEVAAWSVTIGRPKMWRGAVSGAAV